MKVARASVTPWRLPLRVPLRTARGVVRERAGLLLRVAWEDGVTGVGEAAPLAGFGGGTLPEAATALEKLAARLPGQSLDLAGLEAAARGLAASPAARAALDVACHDAAARRAGLPVAALLRRAGVAALLRRVGVAGLLRRAGGAPADPVAVNALLDAATPEALAGEAARLCAAGWRAFKLKVGAHDLAMDLARVRAVREAVGAAAGLRLDANRAWREDEAARALDAFAAARPELVEEPLAGPTPEAFARLRRRTGLPLAVDESLADEGDAARWLDPHVVDAAVLKPAWLGGLAAACRIAERARAAGVACVVTSALDAAVGRAAALHLAAALDGPFAAGLATHDRLARDLAWLAPPVAGRMALPPGPGLGVDP